LHLPQSKLDQVLDRFHQVEARMGAASDGQERTTIRIKEQIRFKPIHELRAGAASDFTNEKRFTSDVWDSMRANLCRRRDWRRPPKGKWSVGGHARSKFPITGEPPVPLLVSLTSGSHPATH
jgi:hypothetical protein